MSVFSYFYFSCFWDISGHHPVGSGVQRLSWVYIELLVCASVWPRVGLNYTQTQGEQGAKQQTEWGMHFGHIHIKELCKDVGMKQSENSVNFSDSLLRPHLFFALSLHSLSCSLDHCWSLALRVTDLQTLNYIFTNRSHKSSTVCL